MPIDIRCPSCRDVFPVTEAPGQQALDCPNCGKRFVAHAPRATGTKCPSCATPSTIIATDRPQPTTCAGCGQRFTVPAAAATAPTPKAPDRSAPPVSAAKTPESARRRPGRDDDDDDDDDGRRAKERGTGGAAVGLIVLGGAGLLFVAAGFVVVAYLIFSRPGPATEPQKVAAAPTQPPASRSVEVNPQPPVRVPAPVKATSPPDPSRSPAAPPARVVALPEPAGEVRVGGGGRYLFIHLKVARQVAVFEPATEKIIRYIPVADDEVLLAAGLNHLILGYPRQNAIVRYSLATFEKDATNTVESKFPLHGLGMGAGSNGPLLVATANFPFGEDLFLVNVLTLRRVPGTEIRNSGVIPEKGMRIWASHEGRVFTAKAGGLSRPSAFQARPDGWVCSPSPCDPPVIGPEGDLVYGKGEIATSAGQTVGEKVGGHGKGVWYTPAVIGPFFLSFSERASGDWPNEQKYLLTGIHAGRDQRPLVTLPELPETAGLVDWLSGQGKPFDQHVFYFPEVNRLAVFLSRRDRVWVRTIDVKAEIAKSTADYLAVVSRSPTATKGKPYRYAPEVWSNRGGVKLRLDAGPTGMWVDGGALMWDVPSNYPGVTAAVILNVTDSTGREIFHMFDVTVSARK